MKTREEPARFGVRPDEAGEPGAPSERRHVVGRVARAAGDDFGGVVLEDEPEIVQRD